MNNSVTFQLEKDTSGKLGWRYTYTAVAGRMGSARCERVYSNGFVGPVAGEMKRVSDEKGRPAVMRYYPVTWAYDCYHLR